MRITKSWLENHYACVEGRCWFKENFPHGGHRYEVLKKLEEANRLLDYVWLLRETLKKCPLPEGLVLPTELWRLCLDGGTLPAGTVLPEGLKWLYLEGGTLPAGTALPDGLWYLDLGGGTLPKGTRVPAGCEVCE
jgi:hypothetical protein